MRARRYGGLLAVPEIYIRINYRCVHWLFLRISTTTKTITIWNSVRDEECNRTYLVYALRYISDVYEDQHQGNVDVEEWKSGWNLQDLSNSSPEYTYMNDTIDFNNTRESIAYLLWLK